MARDTPLRSIGQPDVAIVGVGETRTARQLPEDTLDLIVDAIQRALDDAGLCVGDVDGIVTDASLMSAQAVDAAISLGLGPEVFMAHLGNAGAGVVAAPLLADLALRTGRATTIVSFVGLKLGSEAGAALGPHATDPYKTNLEMPFGFFPQVAYMATMARRYLWEFGYKDGDLGQVPVAQRRWAALHPEAIRRSPLSIEDYLDSSLVADPLRNADCSLISDGAAAFVMTTRARAADCRHPPVFVASCVTAFEALTSHATMSLRPDLTTLSSSLSGPLALQRAGVSASDVDFAELYDCFSIIPVLQLEDLGLSPRGDGLAAYARGDTSPGGRLPVNTHGGLLAHSFLISASHICEAVAQLRGDGGARQVPKAHVGVVTGWAAPEHSTLVLSDA